MSETDRPREIERYREIDRQTERQTDRQTEWMNSSPPGNAGICKICFEYSSNSKSSNLESLKLTKPNLSLPS